MRAVIDLCLAAFRFAIQQALPSECVRRSLLLAANNTELLVNGRRYPLDNNVHVVAFGKAACGMVVGAEGVLSQHIRDGIASVPVASSIPPGLKTEFYTGAHNNLPDAEAVENARRIAEFVQRVKAPDQIILFLISALLPSPVDRLTLEDKLQVIRTLATNGADIKQMNIVRSALSKLKGGKLARLGSPLKMISLIISDVIGDPLQLIASGPTVLDKSDSRTAIDVLNELGVAAKVPETVVNVLSSLVSNSSAYEQDPENVDVNNLIVCNNRQVLELLAEHFRSNGTHPVIVSSTLEGDATELGILFADFMLHASKNNSVDKRGLAEFCEKLNVDAVQDSICFESKRFVLLFGGETTVRFDLKKVGLGAKGGRNQEFALSVFKRLLEANDWKTGSSSSPKFAFFSLGTDGQDGPTDATGAFVTSQDVLQFAGSLEEVDSALNSKNSYGFWSTFNNGSNLVKGGKTGTNLMDVQMAYFDFN